MTRIARRFREVGWLGILLVLVAILAWVGAAWTGRRSSGAPDHSSCASSPSLVPAAANPQSEADGGDALLRYGPYAIQFSSHWSGTGSSGRLLRVCVRDRILLSIKSGSLAELGQPFTEAGGTARDPFLRLGHGRLALPITEPGLGSWICGRTRVFEIADPARCLCDVDLWGRYLYFTDLNDDGRDEIVFGDHNGGGFTVPMKSWLFPPVVLSFRGDRFAVDTDLMRCPAPPVVQLRRWALKIRAKAWKPTVDWSGDILHGNTRATERELQWSIPCVDSLQHLIYSGHADTARQFLHWCWPAGWRGEDEFWRGLLCSLSESSYWREIKAMNPAGSLDVAH